jgi:hypothetical protein
VDLLVGRVPGVQQNGFAGLDLDRRSGRVVCWRPPSPAGLFFAQNVLERIGWRRPRSSGTGAGWRGLGYQQAKFLAEFPNVVPSTFDTGYVDDFAAMMAPLSEGMTVINDGCPGETSSTFILGNLPGKCGNATWLTSWLHRPHPGSQLSDALAFLLAHPRQTARVAET